MFPRVNLVMDETEPASTSDNPGKIRRHVVSVHVACSTVRNDTAEMAHANDLRQQYIGYNYRNRLKYREMKIEIEKENEMVKIVERIRVVFFWGNTLQEFLETVTGGNLHH